MTAPTHIAIGLLFTGTAFSLASLSLSHHLAAAAAAVLGSLLPDLDRRDSLLGRLLPWAARALERWRHRTLTHSLVAGAGLALAALPLAWLQPPVYAALLLGLVSHLLADCATKSGAMLFWPRLDACVLPRAARYRLETGGLAERAVFVALVTFLVLIVPVSPAGGAWRVIRYLLATQAGALSDYQETTTQALLDFRGRWRDTHEEIAGRAPILAASTDGFVIVLDGRAITCGGSGEILLRRTRVLATRQPLQRRTLAVQRQSWDSLLAELPPTAWVSGVLQANRPFVDRAPHPDLPGPGDPVQLDHDRLHLRFAPRPWLAALHLVPQLEPVQRRLLGQRLLEGDLALSALSRRRPRVHWQQLALAEAAQAVLADSLARLDDLTLAFTGTLDLILLEPAP